MNYCTVYQNSTHRLLRSTNYNYNFNKQTGYFERWGETLDSNPHFSPFGPEILDMEISVGECQGNCSFCYKRNGSGVATHNMSLATFRRIFSQLPSSLTQIAFGITDIGCNPDFWKIMQHSRNNGVIPNYTCNGLDVTEEIALKTAKICGAVAVSIVDRESSYNAVKSFTTAGMKQVNIHFMLAEETFDQAFKLIDDVTTDSRLAQLNAVVFLQYKPKGRGISFYHSVASATRVKELVQYAQKMQVHIGFDSCTAPLYLKAIEQSPFFKHLAMYVDPCEAGQFSLYCNVRGEFYPCSFVENENGWETGLFINTSFQKDVWNHPKMQNWRDQLVMSSSECDCVYNNTCQSCLIYSQITACKNEFVQVLDVHE